MEVSPMLKEERRAILDYCMVAVDRQNNGMLSRKSISYQTINYLRNQGISVNYDKGE